MLQLWVRALALHHATTRDPIACSLVHILTSASLSKLLLIRWRWINLVGMSVRVSMIMRLRHPLKWLELVELLLGRVTTTTHTDFLLKIGLRNLLASNRLLLLLIIDELLYIVDILMGLRRLVNGLPCARFQGSLLRIRRLNLLCRVGRLMGTWIFLILVSNYQTDNLLVAQESLTWRWIIIA